MNTRLALYYQILRTYWSRPLIYLLAFAGLALYVNLFVDLWGGNPVQIGARPRPTGHIEMVYTGNEPALPSMDGLLQQHAAEEIESLNLICQNPDDRLPDLTPFSNLTYLSLNGFTLTAEDVNQVCAHPRLDALVLLQSRLPDGALRQFGQKVSQLELLAPVLEAHTDEIKHMSRVKLLALHMVGATPDIFERVTQIPHLEQLTLINSANATRLGRRATATQTWDQLDLTDAQIKQLRTCPTLKEVYADWFVMKRLRHFTVDKLLPVRALPITYPQSKLTALELNFFITGLLFVLLAFQLWAHFISPAAKVTPHYAGPHRQVALIIGGTCFFFLTFALTRHDFALLPSLSLALFLPAFGSLFALTYFSDSRLGQLLLLVIIACFWFIVFVLPQMFATLLGIIGGEAIWFLQGHLPGYTLCIIGVEFLLIGGILYKLPAITVFVNESSSTFPALSPWEKERLQQTQWKKPGRLFSWIIDRTNNDVHYTSRSTWQMIQLWRRGNAFQVLFMFWILAMVLFFGALFRGIMNLAQGEAFFDGLHPLFGGMLASLTGAGVMLPAIGWWQRSKSFELESLKPVSRAALVKQLYLSLALDHFIFLTGFLPCFIYLQNNPFQFNVEWICKLLLIGLAVPLWILGTNVSVLIFKQTWKILGSILGLYVLAAIVVLATSALQFNLPTGELQSPPGLMIAIVTAILAAGLLNALMYRAALKREWG